MYVNVSLPFGRIEDTDAFLAPEAVVGDHLHNRNQGRSVVAAAGDPRHHRQAPGHRRVGVGAYIEGRTLSEWCDNAERFGAEVTAKIA